MRELGDGGRDLETLVQNDFLPLEADVFGPFDETGEVSLGPDVLACTWFKLSVENINRETTTRQRTDTKVFGIRLEQRVLLRLGCLARTKGGRGGFLASSGFSFGLVIETK